MRRLTTGDLRDLVTLKKWTDIPTAALGIERHLSALPFPVLLENIAGLMAPLARGATCIALPLAQVGVSGSSRPGSGLRSSISRLSLRVSTPRSVRLPMKSATVTTWVVPVPPSTTCPMPPAPMMATLRWTHATRPSAADAIRSLPAKKRLQWLLDELGIHFESNASEAGAAAMLGASIHYPVRGAVTWKSIVGTNVAADARAREPHLVVDDGAGVQLEVEGERVEGLGDAAGRAGHVAVSAELRVGAPGLGLGGIHARQFVLCGHDLGFLRQGIGQAMQVATGHPLEGGHRAQRGNRIAAPVKNRHSNTRDAAGRSRLGQGVAVFAGLLDAAGHLAEGGVAALAQAIEGYDVGDLFVGQVRQDGQAERANAHGPAVVDLQDLGVLRQVTLALVQADGVVAAADAQVHRLARGVGQPLKRGLGNGLDVEHVQHRHAKGIDLRAQPVMARAPGALDQMFFLHGRQDAVHRGLGQLGERADLHERCALRAKGRQGAQQQRGTGNALCAFAFQRGGHGFCAARWCWVWSMSERPYYKIFHDSEY